MKTRNKVFIGSGVVLLIILLTGFGLFAAWGPWGGPCRGFHPGFHGRGVHSGFGGKDFLEFALWRMDRRVKALGLSDVQEEKYDEIRARIENHLTEGLDDRKNMIEKFHTEMNKDNPDIAALAESVKKKIKVISKFMEENVDLFVEFYNTLDDDQKRQVIEAVRDRMEHHRS